MPGDPTELISPPLRVHFSLESRPPHPREDTASDLFDYYLEVSVSLTALARAANGWEREIEAVPGR